MHVQVKMTLLLSAVAVPINTVFGVTCAILIARNEFPGKLILTSMLDLPFSISPVVTGQLAAVASTPYFSMLLCLFACWLPPLQDLPGNRSGRSSYVTLTHVRCNDFPGR